MASSKSSEDKLRKLLDRLRSLHLLGTPPDCELTLTQIGMLAWIARSPGCGVLDVATALGLTAPTVSVGIQRLTEDSWLERRQDPDDRRAKPIYLTEKKHCLYDAPAQASRTELEAILVWIKHTRAK